MLTAPAALSVRSPAVTPPNAPPVLDFESLIIDDARGGEFPSAIVFGTLPGPPEVRLSLAGNVWDGREQPGVRVITIDSSGALSEKRPLSQAELRSLSARLLRWLTVPPDDRLQRAVVVMAAIVEGEIERNARAVANEQLARRSRDTFDVTARSAARAGRAVGPT